MRRGSTIDHGGLISRAGSDLYIHAHIRTYAHKYTFIYTDLGFKGPTSLGSDLAHNRVM
jgi:hypothetical protein